jgi:hypothetical protein
LYGFEEAMLILDISIKWIKSLFEYDSEQKIPKILVKHCPKAAVRVIRQIIIIFLRIFLVFLCHLGLTKLQEKGLLYQELEYFYKLFAYLLDDCRADFGGRVGGWVRVKNDGYG